MPSVLGGLHSTVMFDLTKSSSQLYLEICQGKIDFFDKIKIWKIAQNLLYTNNL